MTEKEFKEKLKREIEIIKSEKVKNGGWLLLDELFAKGEFQLAKAKTCWVPDELIDTYIDNAWISYNNERKIEEVSGMSYIEIDAISDFKDEDYKKKERIDNAIEFAELVFGATITAGLLGFVLVRLVNDSVNVSHLLSTILSTVSKAPIAGFLVGLDPYMFIKGLVNKHKARKFLQNLGIEEYALEKLASDETIYNIEHKGRVK